MATPRAGSSQAQNAARDGRRVWSGFGRGRPGLGPVRRATQPMPTRAPRVSAGLDWNETLAGSIEAVSGTTIASGVTTQLPFSSAALFGAANLSTTIVGLMVDVAGLYRVTHSVEVDGTPGDICALIGWSSSNRTEQVIPPSGTSRFEVFTFEVLSVGNQLRPPRIENLGANTMTVNGTPAMTVSRTVD